MNYNTINIKKERIPIISFFSGGGFMDMGFISAGFDVVFANEYDKVFAQLHDEGLFSWAKAHKERFCPISTTESLTDLSPKAIIDMAFPNGVPNLWGIIGGPPCQDFTMNGNEKGFNGERGKMTQVFYNRIRKMKPSFFVMENVVGLLMRKEQKRILDTLLLNSICDDYYIDRQILNALYYGVPQYRKRVFIIGIRKDCFTPLVTRTPSIDNVTSIDFPWPKAKFPNAEKEYDWPSMIPYGTINVIKPESIPYELCVQSCLDNAVNMPNGIEYFELIKNSEKRKEIYEGDTKRRSFKRLHRYRYSPTTCFGNNEIFLHPYKNRRLSVREALRIQGVDDKYCFGPGRLSAKFKIISNGVPTPLAKVVANSLYDFLYDLQRNK